MTHLGDRWPSCKPIGWQKTWWWWSWINGPKAPPWQLSRSCSLASLCWLLLCRSGIPDFLAFSRIAAKAFCECLGKLEENCKSSASLAFLVLGFWSGKPFSLDPLSMLLSNDTKKQDMICIWKWQWCESSSSQECMLDIFYGKKILHCNCLSCLALGMVTRRKYVIQTVLFDFQSCSIKDV